VATRQRRRGPELRIQQDRRQQRRRCQRCRHGVLHPHGRRDTDPNKLRTFLNAGQGQTPPVSDSHFGHPPCSRASILVHVPNASGCAPGETVCASVSLPMGTVFLRPIRPPDGQGTCIISRPCGDGAVCSRWPMSTSPDWIITVSIANGRVSRRPRTGRCRVEACRNVF
jgi:hypothetical protein